MRRWEWGQEAPRLWSRAREVTKPGRPLPPPQGPFGPRGHPPPPPRRSSLPAGGKVSARCGAAPRPAGPSTLARLAHPSAVPPHPPPSSRTPLLASGCGPFSNGRATEIGARTLLPGDPTPDRRWGKRGQGRLCRRAARAWRQDRSQDRSPAYPHPANPSLGRPGQAELGPHGAGQALLVPPHRPSEPGGAGAARPAA